MQTAEQCRAMADDADRLADIVSYARDKHRLRQQAESWRAKAVELEHQPATAPEPHPHRSRLDWLRRLLRPQARAKRVPAG